MNIWDIIPTEQAKTIRAMMRGEEGAFFRAKIAELQQTLNTMPTSYQTDGQGDAAVVHLHYFTGSAEWYITERDREDEQHQAFGLAVLSGKDMELGYISLVELCRTSAITSANLDLHWQPRTLREIRAERAA